MLLPHRQVPNGGKTTTEPSCLALFICELLKLFPSFFSPRCFIIFMKFHDFFSCVSFFTFYFSCCLFFLLRQIFIFTFNTSEDARQCCFFPFSLRIDLRTRPTKQHQCSRFANGTQCEYLMHRSFLSGFYKSI